MIKQVFNIKYYWKVIVYYSIDYNFFDIIKYDLSANSIKHKTISNIYNTMVTNRAKAVTISSFKTKTSIVCFNKHSDKFDYINSVVHEAEHVKQDILEYYQVKDANEPPAYTLGYIVMKMFYVVQNII